MPFRLQTSQLFLTYPQCNLKKEDAFIELTKILKIKEYIIAEELHQNGDPHIHCWIRLEQRLDTQNPRALDIAGFHGKYESCRSNKNVIKYCTKDGDFISNIDIKSIIEARKNKKKIIGSDLIGKRKSLTEVVEEYPEFLFGYKKLKDDLNAYFKDKEDQREHLPNWLPNPWGKLLPSRRNSKRRHYWIFSRQPNVGKTTMFLNPINEDYRCYLKAGDYNYWNIKGDEEAILIDEYNTAAIRWSSLNSMADGSFEYRVFQGGLVRLNKPLIIICSNQSINELYPNMNNFIHERFNEIEII